MGDFLAAAIRRREVKAKVGKLVLRIHGDSLWRWEYQERRRIEAQREAERRELEQRAGEAYSAALSRQRRAREEHDQVVWQSFVRNVQIDMWAREEWVNSWQ